MLRHPSILIILAFTTFTLRAQNELYVHPELDWYTLETNHFLVHYHSGAARTAHQVAEIAEAVYGPITRMYRHEPDQKVSFVIRDHDDYSNGAAYFYDNKIEIWATSLDYELRGTHPWLANVVTHEFTHLIQIQTAMKLSRTIPAIYFQWFGYESARRPDVLYGFPNVLVSYPLSAFVVPSWFAEGTAQYNHPDLRYDFWDTHRDMILRMYMLDGNPLPWEQMAIFGKTSLGNESSYNAGFSIVAYIAETYGEGKLREISDALGDLGRLTIDGAIEKVLGITGTELYDQWKLTMTRHYEQQVEGIRDDLRQGTVLETEGFGNFYPAFAPDGRGLAYVSNKGGDYFSQSSVYYRQVGDKSSSRIIEGVRSTLSFSPDGSVLYYSRITHKNPHWSRLSDLYEYNIEDREETRLTHGLRARNPKVSRDGSRLVFVSESDGTSNIGVCNSDGTGVRFITAFSNAEQVFTPSWSPDGATIAFGLSTGHGQSLAMIDSSGGNMRIVVSDADTRNPVFSSDGEELYFSSDVSGIFNVYSMDLRSGGRKQITNVLGGAFLPAVNDSGLVAFATYTSDGYKIAVVQDDGEKPEAPPGSRRQLALEGRDFSRSISPSHSTIERSYDAGGPVYADSSSIEGPRPYRSTFSSLTLIPLVRVDNYNPHNKGFEIVKPGIYFMSSDRLEKLNLFGGAAMNVKFERDLFFILEYRDRLPLLNLIGVEPSVALEVYNVTRETIATFELTPYTVSTDVSYNLLEFDLAFQHPLLSDRTNLRLWYTYSRYSADIGSFTNPNTGMISPAFRNTYLIGNSVTARLYYDGLIPTVDREINPVGREIRLVYSFEFNKFNAEGDYEVKDGLLVPIYEQVNFHRVDLRWNEHFEVPFRHHTVNIGLRGATIVGKQVDDFFDFYGGGFIGMKGYPFYSLGGNSLAVVNLSYRFPISRSIGFRFLQFYFTKIYASVYADFGNAWTGHVPSASDWKKDAGVELRLESFSFYSYPTRFFFSASYGFDRFVQRINRQDIMYGKEWNFHLGILFGFELNDMLRRGR